MLKLNILNTFGPDRKRHNNLGNYLELCTGLLKSLEIICLKKHLETDIPNIFIKSCTFYNLKLWLQEKPRHRIHQKDKNLLNKTHKIYLKSKNDNLTLLEKLTCIRSFNCLNKGLKNLYTFCKNQKRENTLYNLTLFWQKTHTVNRLKITLILDLKHLLFYRIGNLLLNITHSYLFYL